MKKLKFLMAGGMLAIAVVAGLVFGITAGYGGADDAAIQAASDADLQGQRERAQALVAQLQAGGFSGDISGDGITVHGRWNIEIRDPDGALVSSQEFDNGLVPLGKESLAKFLSRERIPGLWHISLFGSGASTQPCLNDSNNPEQCEFIEATDTCCTNNYFQKVLTVSRVGDTVVLQGNGVVQNEGDIVSVVTRVFDCDPANPASCSFLASQFSGKPITPEPVVPGQSVLVTVTFSFN